MTGTPTEPAPANARRVRIAIIGTGFGGLGMAIGLKRRGISDFVLFERAGDIGGTWRDNTYPGCQCDVPSHLYSFSFAPNPGWSRTYSMQREIWDYLRDCSRRFDLDPHIRFGHAVEGATWDEAESSWRIQTSRGPWIADVLISAHGALSEPAYPSIPGLDAFEGDLVHTGAWGKGPDLAGKRVAVIGTGASAIQVVPGIQPHVERLSVFQRTPGWVLPHTDRPITKAERFVYRRFPPAQRIVRAGIYLAREALVPGLARHPRATEPIRWLALAHLRRQVRDRDLRLKLTPTYAPGCKRLLLSDDFYPALTSENVELVTDPIEEIGGRWILTADGTKRAFDVIVFGTGFRVTDQPMADVIRGRNGESLAAHWRRDGIRAYLGTTVDGFPNLFLMTGPNTGIGHTSLVVMIEAQVRYIAESLRYMDERGAAAIEVTREAVDAFNREVERKLQPSVWMTGGCASWYLDETGRNPTLWPDYTWRFRRLLRRFDPCVYRASFRRPAVPRVERRAAHVR